MQHEGVHAARAGAQSRVCRMRGEAVRIGVGRAERRSVSDARRGRESAHGGRESARTEREHENEIMCARWLGFGSAYFCGI